MIYVAGEVAGRNRPNERLMAASENVMFAPHWWQRVAVEPTSVPQAGQMRGRAFSWREPKIEENLSRKRSSFQRRRGDSGNGFPCEKISAFL